MSKEMFGQGPEFSGEHTIPSPDWNLSGQSGQIGRVQENRVVKLGIAASTMITFTLAACGGGGGVVSGGALGRFENNNARTTEPTPTHFIIPRPDPTSTLSLPSAKDIIEIRQFIQQHGTCPPPPVVGPQLDGKFSDPTGAVCEGE